MDKDHTVQAQFDPLLVIGKSGFHSQELSDAARS